MTKVQVWRRLWNTDLVTVGVRVVTSVDGGTLATDLYSVVVKASDQEKVQRTVDVANSTAMCCVMAMDAVGVSADLETLD